MLQKVKDEHTVLIVNNVLKKLKAKIYKLQYM